MKNSVKNVKSFFLLSFDFLAFGKVIMFYLTFLVLLSLEKGFTVFAHFNKKTTKNFKNLTILNLRNFEIQYFFVLSVNLLIFPETMIQMSDFR